MTARKREKGQWRSHKWSLGDKFTTSPFCHLILTLFINAMVINVVGKVVFPRWNYFSHFFPLETTCELSWCRKLEKLKSFKKFLHPITSPCQGPTSMREKSFEKIRENFEKNLKSVSAPSPHLVRDQPL